jgi:hypothetical protein
MKRNVFFIFSLFLGCVSLFPSPRYEGFMVTNLSNKELLFNFEYHELLGEVTRITINDVDVDIHFTLSTTTWILRPNRYVDIILYLPVFNLAAEPNINYFYDRLAEIPFCEKAKAFFKFFSVYTVDGECIIRDIDGLCAASIRQSRTGYNLVFFDSGTYYTDEELEQALNTVIRSNGS